MKLEWSSFRPKIREISKTILTITGIFLIIILVNQFALASAVQPYPGLSPDTSDPRMEAFKTFSDSFFTAVKKEDTVFLKTHILFPIRYSTFGVLEPSLSKVDAITSNMFFKRLKKLFPADFLKDIRSQGEYTVRYFKSETYYMISVYYTQGGVDSNVKWHFKMRNNQFYFYTFTSEAG